MKLLEIYEKSDMFKGAKGGELPIEKESMFVTGVVMREIFFPALSLKNSREGYSFEQLWFALCLCHDKRMEGACMDINGKWSPMHFQFSPLFHYVGEGIQFTNGTKVSECILSEAEIEDYFYFRSTCFYDGGTDHGIVGGLLLYNSLICRHLQRIGVPDGNSLNLYSYAANTLLIHNICWGIKGSDKITPGMDPLLFLLLLAEVLEPLQYAFVCMEYKELLRQIEVEVSEREIRLVMDPNYFAIKRLENNLREVEKKIEVDCKIWSESAEVCITL